MKKTGAKALFAAAALLAFADGGFACENCPDDEPAATAGAAFSWPSTSRPTKRLRSMSRR